jgi:hypothetical protein
MGLWLWVGEIRPGITHRGLGFPRRPKMPEARGVFETHSADKKFSGRARPESVAIVTDA